jgi:hypothetical protein
LAFFRRASAAAFDALVAIGVTPDFIKSESPVWARTQSRFPKHQYDFLEFVLQTELQLAIGQIGAGDFSEVTITEESIRIRELWCVKSIEKLRPKLQRMIFAVGHLETLAQ